MSVSLQGQPALRIGLILMLGAAALWLAVSVSLAGIYRIANPDMVRRWAPFDAGANARSAFALLESAGPKAPPETRELAARALARDPSNVVAVRTLGLLASLNGDEARALRLFRYSQRLSRRDLPTHLWFIEYNVGKNDIAGALAHYDEALRTSPSSGQLLFPILVQASSDPAIARPLHAMLLRKPVWWHLFATRSIGESADPATAEFVTRGLLDPARPEDRELIEALLARLVAAKQYERAWQTYGRAGGAVGETDIRDGGFEREPGLPPFEWQMTEEVEIGAEQLQRESGSGQALFLRQASGRAGVVARQLLLLPPGAYGLRAEIGGATGETLARPSITIACAERPDQALLAAPFPLAPQPVLLAQEFAVPPGCAAQWLSIRVNGRMETSDVQPWIDSVTIRRR